MREGLNEGFRFNNPHEKRPLRLRRIVPRLAESLCPARRASPHGSRVDRARPLRPVRTAAALRARLDALEAAYRRCRRRCIPDRFAARHRCRAARGMQWATRANEATGRCDPPASARLPVRDPRRADRGRDQHGDAGRFPRCSRWNGARRCDEARGDPAALAGAGRRSRRRGPGYREAADGRSSTCTTTTRRRPRWSRKLMFLERLRAELVDAPRTRIATRRTDMALLQISEPGECRPSRTSDGSRSASTSARRIRWWPPCATASPRCCPTRRAARCCRRSCATWPMAASRSGYDAQAAPGDDPRNTIVSVKRFMGRGVADVARIERRCLRLRRRARHGAASSTAAGVK